MEDGYASLLGFPSNSLVAHSGELVVLALVVVVELGRIQRVRARERVVDLRLLLLPGGLQSCLLVRINQAYFGILEHLRQDLAISLSRLREHARDDTSHLLSEALTVGAPLLVVVLRVSSIDVCIAIDELVHFLCVLLLVLL